MIPVLSRKSPRRTTTDEISGDNILPDNSFSSAYEVISNIDLLRHILLFLPVKSLLVSKSVSKRWLSLISDPYFAHDHCLRNRRSIPGIFLYNRHFYPYFDFVSMDGQVIESLPFKNINFLNDPLGTDIEQSCNGLLCCSCLRANSNDRTYYIYNLSTKHYTVLPQSRLRKDGFVSVCSVSLVYDPSKSNHYEVVCIWRDDHIHYHIEIYSSKTATWRASGDPFLATDVLFYRSGVFWNGSLHWISVNDDDSCDLISLREESFVVFDVGRELLRKMPVPPQPNEECDRRRIGYFGECRGHLYLIQIYGQVTTTCFDILEMDTEYIQWTVKYQVDLEILTFTYPEMVLDIEDEDSFGDHFEYSVLLVEEEEESCKLMLRIPEKVISYDLKEKNFKKIHDITSGIQYEWFHAFQYIESIACV